MSDGVQLNAGSGGAVLATDEIVNGTLTGTFQYQVTKVAFGTLNSETWVDSSNGLPVAQQGTWNVGTVTTLSTITNVVHVDDNSGSLTVDGTVGVSGTVTTEGSGTSGAPSGGVLTVQGPGPGATALVVNGSNFTQPISGTVSISGTIGITANSSVNVAQLAGTTTDTNSGSKSAGTLRVVIATDQPQLTNKLLVTPDAGSTVTLVPAASGGLTISRTLSAASTNATSVKGSAGQLYGVLVSNINAAARYLKLYNKATAPTVGTDTPVMSIMIPPNSSGVAANWENGLAFGTGIAFALTTGATDADTGAVAANEQIVHLFYK